MVYAAFFATMFQIVSGHPLVDGNKRTAAFLGELFIRKNGFGLEVTDDAKRVTRKLIKIYPIIFFLYMCRAMGKISLVHSSIKEKKMSTLDY